MLVGEPGSGKTRMTEQLATYARLCNAQVLTWPLLRRRGRSCFLALGANRSVLCSKSSNPKTCCR